MAPGHGFGLLGLGFSGVFFDVSRFFWAIRVFLSWFGLSLLGLNQFLCIFFGTKEANKQTKISQKPHPSYQLRGGG